MSISRSPRVATAMGEATTSLTIAYSSEERVDRRGVRCHGGKGREGRGKDLGGLQPVPGDEEDDPFAPVDPPVLARAFQGGDRRASCGFREDSLRPREEPLRPPGL